MADKITRCESPVPELGHMDIPADFPYEKILQKGRPQHDGADPFRIRHPKMETGKRAKIFAPFDALRGFSDAIRETQQKAEDQNHTATPLPKGI